MRTVTPLQLEILLHTYYSPAPWKGDCSLTPYKQAIEYFLKHGIITESVPEENLYELTDRGNAYIEAILALPFPTKHWIVELAQ